MQPRSEETRKGILEAAVRRFCLAGYDAASVSDICKEAGVSKGAFYHHFPSKQELFLAIIADWLQNVDAQLFLRNSKGETVPQALAQMAKKTGFVFEAASGQLPMFMEFMVQASRDQTIWKATIAPYRRYQAQFAEMIEKGKAEGSIRADANAQITSWALLSMAVGVLLQGVVGPEMADWNEVIQSGITMILDSIKKE